ncbi:hypothetical protein FHX42_005217 [Saccharopolyspora lacisalsi]|uniref:Uncharacterized protein n=1 Tax=Halosaccharopolyspora lacisalsi TaxID=1000566 RepID=A0A839E442_9PSEU|nr:hypothetical protein [Halosaccharopolyspora lacisalsi]MBA8827810.1 hypothetical protein [Halosaccharopolyspora lacisalsi]
MGGSDFDHPRSTTTPVLAFPEQVAIDQLATRMPVTTDHEQPALAR